MALIGGALDGEQLVCGAAAVRGHLVLGIDGAVAFHIVEGFRSHRIAVAIHPAADEVLMEYTVLSDREQRVCTHRQLANGSTVMDGAVLIDKLSLAAEIKGQGVVHSIPYSSQLRVAGNLIYGVLRILVASAILPVGKGGASLGGGGQSAYRLIVSDLLGLRVHSTSVGIEAQGVLVCGVGHIDIGPAGNQLVIAELAAEPVPVVPLVQGIAGTLSNASVGIQVLHQVGAVQGLAFVQGFGIVLVPVGHTVNHNVVVVGDHAVQVGPAVYRDGFQLRGILAGNIIVPAAVVEPAIHFKAIAGGIVVLDKGGNFRALFHFESGRVVHLGSVAVAVNLDLHRLGILKVRSRGDFVVVGSHRRTLGGGVCGFCAVIGGNGRPGQADSQNHSQRRTQQAFPCIVHKTPSPFIYLFSSKK